MLGKSASHRKQIKKIFFSAISSRDVKYLLGVTLHLNQVTLEKKQGRKQLKTDK